MSGARQGRRRRILQEEVLSASREFAAYNPDDDTLTNDTPRSEGRRYALPEGSLAGALAKHHFPSHLLTPVSMIIASVVGVGVLGTLHVYQPAISAAMGGSLDTLVDATSPTSLAKWVATAAMLATAMLAGLIMVVRRHRVDDYRGRHRLWRGAMAVAALLSVDAATNLHDSVAKAAHQLTGVSLMAGNQGWWLAVGTVVLGWVAFRVFSDIKQSKLATTVLGVSLATGLVAVIAPLAGLGGTQAKAVSVLAQTACYLLVASAAVSYMRFLRHDVVAGVVTKPHLTKSTEVKLSKETTATAKTESKPTDNSPKTSTARQQKLAIAKESTPVEEAEETQEQPRRSSRRERQQPKVVSSESSSSQWTDGSDGYSDNYDDGQGSRKLSKSDRKRLRKEKASRRAA